MFKKPKPFDYPNYDPPFEPKPLDQLSDTEANQRFEWLVEQSEGRRQLLIACIEATARRGNECDYTSDSLVPLWESMSGFFAWRPPTAEERRSFSESLPAVAKGLQFDQKEMTTQTLCLALDIGFYVAEVYMRKFPAVRWILHKGKDRNQNKAALLGFRLPLVPSDMVLGSIAKQLTTPKSTHLLDIYRVWERDLLE